MGMRPTTFHELYSQYAQEVHRFALFLTGNAADAADITAETFVRVWTAAGNPQLESVKAYLFTIARNLHRKQWRRNQRCTELDHEICDPAATPDASAEQQDEMRRMLSALQRLSELDRTVLSMRAGELSYQDIASATGLSVPTAKVRVFRARERLYALLHPIQERSHERD